MTDAPRAERGRGANYKMNYLHLNYFGVMKKNIIKDDRHEFEIVGSFPDDAFVWNIGRQNFKHECYIPLAFLDTSYPDQYHVDVKRLKAIKVESEEIAIYIAEVAHRKTVDKKEFEEIIKSFEVRNEVENFWKDKKDYESTPQSAELMANNID